MDRHLNILMISHHRRHKAYGRPHAMAKNLVLRGHDVSLMVIAENRRLGVVQSLWDGVRVIETPDFFTHINSTCRGFLPQILFWTCETK